MEQRGAAGPLLCRLVHGAVGQTCSFSSCKKGWRSLTLRYFDWGLLLVAPCRLLTGFGEWLSRNGCARVVDKADVEKQQDTGC